MSDPAVRYIKVPEAEFNRIKELVAELRHFISNVNVTEFVDPDKTRKPFTNEEKKLIEELSAQGKSTYEVSQLINRRYNSVKNYMKKRSTTA